ncbi:MAG: GIY-YIG nuclease family protein [Bacteroidota bacterium]
MTIWEDSSCMNRRRYYVYFLSNGARTVLYCGVTNDLARRLQEHRSGTVEGFTKRYRVHDLLWFETLDDVHDAIAREKQLKNWRRVWKWNLIRESNPGLRDLSLDPGWLLIT